MTAAATDRGQSLPTSWELGFAFFHEVNEKQKRQSKPKKALAH